MLKMAANKLLHQKEANIKRLAKMLAQQHSILAAAGSDPNILAEYASLIKYLQAARREELERIFGASSSMGRRASEKGLITKNPKAPESDPAIERMSISELEHVILNDATPRKYLERIAISRFKVPRGSMRSYSNRNMLVEKLLTLIRNEQAHSAIEAVTRAAKNYRMAP